MTSVERCDLCKPQGIYCIKPSTPLVPGRWMRTRDDIVQKESIEECPIRETIRKNIISEQMRRRQE
mgnify:CR=1 FL=1